MKKLLICKIYRQLLACFLVIGTLHSPTASAGEIDYTIMPYLWTAGIDADIGRPGQTIPVDVSFSDYADLIDIGAAVYFEARGDRWSFISSLLWVKLAEDIQTPKISLPM